MKLSAKQLTELLSDLGVDVELVESDNADFKSEDLTQSIVTAVTPTISAQLEEKLESSIGAKNNKTALSAIQFVFGIPKSELDGKTFKEMFAVVKERISSTDETEAGKWKTKYEDAVREYETKLEEKDTEWQSKYDTDIASEKKKYQDRDINDFFIKETEKLPRKGGDLLEQADTLRYKAEKQGYEIKVGENGSIELWKDGKKAKSEEVIKSIAEKVLPIATDTRHVSPAAAKAGQAAAQEGIATVEDNPLAALENWANGE